MKRQIDRIVHFVQYDVWRVQRQSLAWKQRQMVLIARIVILSLRGFFHERCGLRSAALTLYSLLSIVPVLALAFGIAQGFNLQDRLKQEIRNFVDQSDTSRFVTQITNTLARNGKQQDKTTSGVLTFADEASTDVFGQELAAASDAPATSNEDERTTTTVEAPSNAAQAYVQIADKLIEFADKLLEKTSGGLIAGFGVLVLIFTMMKVLNNIERAFNEIWGVHRSRTLARKFSDYLAIAFILPVMFVFSNSITVWLATKVHVLTESSTFLSTLKPFVALMLSQAKMTVIWPLFALMYMLIPNTQVRLVPAFTAGIIGGTIYSVVQTVYISLQVIVSNYNAIYGSFAALPLFIIWVQLSWQIVLLGGQISFAHQNADLFEYETDCLEASHSLKRLLTLRITLFCVECFMHNEAAPDARTISLNLGIPIRLVNDLLNQLTQCGVLAEVVSPRNQDSVYQPGRPLDRLKVHDVLEAWEHLGRKEELPLVESEQFNKLNATLKAFDEQLRAAPFNILLADLVKLDDEQKEK
ncbi:YihY family inner membrane protein [Candidatus Sumerlaeota bacterium]|nr:YihY family inner membrane protein [Candidatus Sumerlaeota bacterium]